MSTSQQTDPLIGRLVDGRYRVRARIARGGMATVYVATDLRLERRVALKVMHSHLSDDSVFQSRFIQEARAAARLADPHVVNVFDQGQDGDMAYLVMEYLPGITLRELLREQRRLTVPQAISILDAVLSGLAAAHKAGIVHRDVKPENVLLAEDGRIKIGDFGLARATTANTASGAQLLGTIAYLAPELVTRGTADARSDIYAIGIMLYEMLTGEQPYKGEQPMQIAFQHATDSVPRPSVKNPGVPEPLDELVLWATEKSPDERPVDAREMLTRLREIERELGVSPVVARTGPIGVVGDATTPTGELTAVLPSTATGPVATLEEADNAARLRTATQRRRTRGAWLIVLVLLLAAVAGGVGWWFGSGPGSMVVVADVTGQTYDDAAARLKHDTLIAVRAEESSLDVAAGNVIRTKPEHGTRVDRDTEVTVVVSTGPAEATFPSFSGMTDADARSALTAQSVDVPGESAPFYTDAPAGTVIGVYIRPAGAPDDGSQDVACLDGCTVHQGDTARIQVSLGPLPDVSGQSEGKARSTLEGLNLVVADSTTEASDSIAEGKVIRVDGIPESGWLAPGDTVTLVVSTGPPLFPVPDVVGDTRDQAIKKLEDAGFQVDYAPFFAVVPDDITEVKASDPEADSMHPKGTRVYIQLSVTG
ncbi:Stk1 family PASTA domain-containing Ser/Thr kinase [Microbacterium jejuense]|uniref:non-specific serine/threonine protein kinase n=1 Tax=Microbacterium jejuense TaxID=1263637 RepID=A0ABS7HN12_9MICO|nr:Stk1 family PASTA domain-containing Ser/Thr kinase [Microbacterium jejuense]MBW9094048.1 Stk1 family PASTA domain-containing Ser/Thr kinase [Microbacterium jejuense]